MKIGHLLEKVESGPSGVQTFQDLGNKTFKKFEVVVTPTNKNLKQYADSFPIDTAKDNRDAMMKALEKFNSELIEDGVINRELSADEVKFKLSEIGTETQPQRINDYMGKQIMDAGSIEAITNSDRAITLGNIQRIIQRDIAGGAGGNRAPVLSSILSHFITEQVSFPVTVLNDQQSLISKYGFEKTSDLINDFAEILAPVGLLTGNLNGNGQRLLTHFLGGSEGELRQSATIHFQPVRNFPLVDSYIEYNGRIVSISSKSNGGAAAKFTGFLNSIKEIETNPIAKKMWDEMLSNPKIARAYEVLKVVMSGTDDEEELAEATKNVSANQQRMIDFIERSKRIMELVEVREYGSGARVGITDNDLNLFNQFISGNNIVAGAVKKSDKADVAGWQDKNTADKFMAMLSSNQRGGFSPEFKNIFRFYRTPGNPGGSQPPTFNPWGLFRKGCSYHITEALNKDQIYSDVLTWIFNHSAVVQVSLSTTPTGSEDKEGNGYASTKAGSTKPLVFYNMIATWPSTGVEHVQFTWGASETDLHHKLLVNGHDKAFPVKRDPDDVTALLNKTDPVTDAMIQRQGLDMDDPRDALKIEKIRQQVKDLRANKPHDVAVTPDDLARSGVGQTSTMRSADGKASISAALLLSKEEAYRAAAAGLTDSEVKQKYSNVVKVKGGKNNPEADFFAAVREARATILNYVLNRNTDKKVRDSYNKLIKYDLVGNGGELGTNIYEDDAAAQGSLGYRHHYHDQLDREKSIIIKGIRNFERMRQAMPERFQQLVADSGLQNPNPVSAGGDIQPATGDDIEAKKILNAYIAKNAAKYRQIPRHEQRYVYSELVDMIKLGADEEYISSAIANWQQTLELAGEVQAKMATAKKSGAMKSTKPAKQPVKSIVEPAKATTSQSASPAGALEKMRRFIVLTGLIKNETSPMRTGNKLFAYARGIMNGTQQFPAEFEVKLRELINDQQVALLVNKKTQRINGHPADVDALNENMLDDTDTVVNIIAVLYWAYMARAYHGRYPNKNYYQVALDNLKKFANELNTTPSPGEHRTQARTINSIGSDIMRGVTG
jgi:hypothetical protein